MKNTEIKKIENVKVTDDFWRSRMDVIRDEVIPYQWEAINDRIPDAPASHAIKNFRIAAGEISGEFFGFVFQDSDVAKWLEAVAYSLESDPNPELEKTADQVIDLIERAQQKNGYLNTYFTVKEPEGKWSNLRDRHEMYCAGHMIEAAVAYYQVTGKRKLLDIMCRFADHINAVFGKDGNKIPGYDGHQEIELALVKLYQETGLKRYLKLSKYFIDERGQKPHFFDYEKEARNDDKKFWWNDEYGDYSYHQAHLPVREQKEAIGHAVRAMYMYTAMADLARETGDESLKEACETLWENVTQRQMYITGGVGSQDFGEAFSFDYDLPNDTCYTETCASIGLVFWAKRMLGIEKNREYADVMERALYNGTISGMDLDGKKFFYVNPLEVWPKASEKRKDKEHVKPIRQKWYSCACCPPNLARLISSIGHYIYSTDRNEVFVHLYMGNESELDIGGQKVQIVQETKYPWDEHVKLTLSPETSSEFTMAVRIPGWCQGAILKVNGKNVEIPSCLKNGYAYLTRMWEKGDEIELFLPMPIERIRANPKVRENAGKVALQRGPVVYCLEEVDNGTNLSNIRLPQDAKLHGTFEENLLEGIYIITAQAEQVDETEWNEELYKPIERKTKPIPLKAIPYYSWCNRKPGEMIVWIAEN
ncbi:glycoside hydrolase family 127 protein [Rossellomorea sp. BNER]|uniref:glycoside hydrolase family 127 protein n=1 Tax=Rossellomorea sp. BNER TaxID=2962031 RepID=UPI003AF2F94E|nr:glycoside hydrolase family 127 protein [Rossellomorea sp. BNER]